MPVGAPEGEKVDILKKILDKKDILFGDFKKSESTYAEKGKAWEEIFNYGKSQGYSWLNGKSWAYHWDKWWPNQKQSTVEKRDKKRPTGGEGGKELK